MDSVDAHCQGPAWPETVDFSNLKNVPSRRSAVPETAQRIFKKKWRYDCRALDAKKLEVGARFLLWLARAQLWFAVTFFLTNNVSLLTAKHLKAIL
jgi:hypothetical protein